MLSPVRDFDPILKKWRKIIKLNQLAWISERTSLPSQWILGDKNAAYLGTEFSI
jgi:hypothetical protein